MFKIVIPARFNSSRFPGKPLALIAGQTMIQHVYSACLKSKASEVVVATDHDGIAKTVRAFGGRVVMTSPDCKSGTDRAFEVAQKLDWGGSDIVVNVQGDEPLIDPEHINAVAEGVLLSGMMATLASVERRIENYKDRGVCKVVFDEQGTALMFSRSPIPGTKDAGGIQKLLESSLVHKHIGIYAYTLSTLSCVSSMPVHPIEEIESLEQLRPLFAGIRIHVTVVEDNESIGVDTPEDLQVVKRIIEAR